MPIAQQARSRATEERILEATETLLSRSSFDDLSVSGIAAAAGISVGGFYARFDDKGALLEALHSRYEERRTRRLDAALARERWVDAGSLERVRGIVAEIVDLMIEERHVLRTFLLRYWMRPAEATPEFIEKLEGLYSGASEILLIDRALMQVDDPDEAVRAALGIVMGACRDIIVMKPESIPGHPRLTRDRLIDYLTSATLGVVALHEPEGTA